MFEPSRAEPPSKMFEPSRAGSARLEFSCLYVINIWQCKVGGMLFEGCAHWTMDVGFQEIHTARIRVMCASRLWFFFITSITMLFFSSDSMLYIYKRYLSFRERTACVSAFICVMPAWTRICMHICMQAYARMLAYTRVYVHIREYDLLYMLTYTFMVLHVQTRVSMRTPRERIYIYETWWCIHQSAQSNGKTFSYAKLSYYVDMKRICLPQTDVSSMW